MVRAKIKGVNTVRKRLAGGRSAIYYYHRATGRRLEGVPGSPEFIASFHDAEQSVSARHSGTLNALIHKWSISPGFAQLAESTRREYVRMLTKIEVNFGTLPIAALDDHRVRKLFMDWRDKIATESGQREADNRMSVVSSLLTWALEQGEVSANRLAGFKRLYRSSRVDKIWLPEHIDAFMKAAPIEMQRAMIVALHTGQRQGDILRLAWGNYDGEGITLRQGKTGRKVDFRCTKALKRLLDAVPRRGAVVLTTKTGRPWTSRYFKHEWEKATAKAGIDGLHFHDLRGTAITMLAEAGCNALQIAAITGHTFKSVEKILETYLSRTRHLADAAIFNFENARATEFANRLQTGGSASAKRSPK